MALKGIKFTDEHRRKLSLSKLGEKNHYFGKKLSEEHRRKISQNNGRYWLGKKRPEITNAWKRGKPRLGNPKNWKHSIETRKKIGESKRGEKCYFWKGGVAYYPYPDDWTDVLRDSIRLRDGYMCQLCEIHQDELVGRFKRLAVHHIDYNKNNCNPQNLISLCQDCHRKTNFNRSYWIKHFVQ